MIFPPDRTLRVAVDDQIFTTQRRGGISRYYVELIAALQRRRDLGIDVYTPWRYSVNDHALDAGLARRPPRPVSDRGSVARALNRLSSAPCAPTDIRHLSYYNRKAMNAPAQARVATLYDMIPELYPGMFPKGSPHRDKQQVLEGVDLVISISQSAADDMTRFYSVTSPVMVIPLGVSSTFRPTSGRVPSLPHQYVLFVGGRGGYKDFPVLLEAAAEANLPRRGIHLVAAGGGQFSDCENSLFRKLGLDGWVHQTSFTDNELIAAYSHAVCFVFPSRYEGFGLPTLEAMACGCPTVLADTSAHPEVGGPAALYFPAGDAVALAGRLRQVLEDTNLVHQMRRQGLARSAAMSWTRTAVETAAAYRALVSDDA